MLSDEWLPRYRLLENFTAKWNGNGNGNGNAYDRGDYNSSFALRAVELKNKQTNKQKTHTKNKQTKIYAPSKIIIDNTKRTLFHCYIIERSPSWRDVTLRYCRETFLFTFLTLRHHKNNFSKTILDANLFINKWNFAKKIIF